MKRSLLFPFISFAFLAVSMTACEWFNSLLDFSFTTGYEEIPFTVDPSAAGEYTFVEKVMQSDLEAEIQDHGGDISNLQNVTIKEAVLGVLTPGQNLDAFEWIEVYVSTQNHPEVLVGSVHNISNGLLSVDLELTDESLKEILQEEEYIVKVIGSLGEDLLVAVDLVVKIKYEVEVGA
jgi:hypothetical protein